MAQLDDLLEDNESSGAFDADLEPTGFEPLPDEKASGVVIVEPPIIHIGRAKLKDERKRMSDLPPNADANSSRDN